MSIKDFVTEQDNLDIVYNMITKVYNRIIKKEDARYMTELVLKRAKALTKAKSDLKSSNKGLIESVIKSLDVSEEDVVDALIYFNLIVETVIYEERIKQLLQGKEE